MGAIDEAFSEIELALGPQVFGEVDEYLVDDAAVHPCLIPPVHGLERRIPRGQVGPLGARAQDPEDRVEDVPRFDEGPSATLRRRPPLACRDEGLDDCPLSVGEVHPDR